MPVNDEAARRAARMRFTPVALSCLVTLGVIAFTMHRYGLSALAVDHAAVRGWLGGDSLYAYRSPATQAGAAAPPALALLLSPLAVLPLPVAGWLLALVEVSALALALMVLTGPRWRGLRVLAAAFRRSAVSRRSAGSPRSAASPRSESPADECGQLRELEAPAGGRGRLRALVAPLGGRRWLSALATSATGAQRWRPAFATSATGTRRWRRAFAASATGGRRWRPALVAPAVAVLVLAIEPVRAGLGLGRPELLVFGLVVADLLALRRAARARAQAWRRERTAARLTDDRTIAGMLRRGWLGGAWAGAGIGVATAIDVVPVLFIGYLLLTRQRRAAGTALATAGALTLGAALAAPAETVAWFGATLWEVNRAEPIGATANQSLAGVLARLYGFAAPPVLVWVAFGLLLLAVGMIRARAAHADGDEVAAFAVIGLTAAVVCPVSDPCEAIWLLPALLVLADVAARRRRQSRLPGRFTGAGYTVAALLGYALLVADTRWTLPWNAYAFALIVLVNALPWRPSEPVEPPRRPSARMPAGRPVAIPVPRGG